MSLENEGDSKKPVYNRSKLSGGPHQLGDPDDLSLRKIERNVLVPELMRNKARKEMCKDINLEFANCCSENGILMAFKCNGHSQRLKDCIKTYFEDPEFRKLCTKEYLEERSEYRRTGIGKKRRSGIESQLNADTQSKV